MRENVDVQADIRSGGRLSGRRALLKRRTLAPSSKIERGQGGQRFRICHHSHSRATAKKDRRPYRISSIPHSGFQRCVFPMRRCAVAWGRYGGSSTGTTSIALSAPACLPPTRPAKPSSRSTASSTCPGGKSTCIRLASLDRCAPSLSLHVESMMAESV